MMSLEALALRRAEEQLEGRRGRDLPWNPAWRPAPRERPLAKGRHGPPITCLCGSCTKCHKREWARRDRAKRAKSTQVCSVDGCMARVHTGRRCWRHHWQFVRWGVSFPNRRRVASPEVIAKARSRLAARGIEI